MLHKYLSNIYSDYANRYLQKLAGTRTNLAYCFNKYLKMYFIKTIIAD